MKSRKAKYAGLVASVIALALIVVLYAAFATVDLVFVKDGYEVSRQEDVSVLKEVELYEGNGEESYTYTFTSGDETVELADDCSNLKTEIVKTVVLNLVTLNWGEEADDITITVK